MSNESHACDTPDDCTCAIYWACPACDAKIERPTTPPKVFRSRCAGPIEIYKVTCACGSRVTLNADNGFVRSFSAT